MRGKGATTPQCTISYSILPYDTYKGYIVPYKGETGSEGGDQDHPTTRIPNSSVRPSVTKICVQ